MSRNQAKRELLSAIIAETLDDEVVTLGALADRAARHGFGLLMIVLSLPTLFPALPPGLAPFVGFLYVVLAAQMLVGLERPWLPARVRRYRLSARAKQMLRQRGVRFLRRGEQFTPPRQLGIPDAVLTRVVAIAVLLLGIALFSPLPFFHLLPALDLMILGFGLINRDASFPAGSLALPAGAVSVAVVGAEKLAVLLHWFLGRGQ